MVPAVGEKKKQRRQIHNLAPAAIEQVWMVPTMGEKKKQKCQIHILALAAIEQVWMVPAMRNPIPRTRDTWCWVKSKFCHTKNMMRSTPASDFGWRKRDFFLVQLKGRNIFGLCLPCLNCVILNLGDACGFCRGLGSFTLTLILDRFTP